MLYTFFMHTVMSKSSTRLLRDRQRFPNRRHLQSSLRFFYYYYMLRSTTTYYTFTSIIISRLCSSMISSPRPNLSSPSPTVDSSIPLETYVSKIRTPPRRRRKVKRQSTSRQTVYRSQKTQTTKSPSKLSYTWSPQPPGPRRNVSPTSYKTWRRAKTRWIET